MPEELNTVIVGSKPVENYVLATIVMLNQGLDYIIIKGKGINISKAVDVYNALKSRLGDTVRLDGVEIGSERARGGIASFIKIRVKRVF